MTYYEVLGVRPGASASEVRRAYLDGARRFHPDVHAEHDAATRANADFQMRQINEAWEVLGNADRRQAYDRTLVDEEMEQRQEERRRRPAGSPNPEFRPFFDDDTDYAELLDNAPTGNGARVPRLVQLAPAILLVAAIFTLCAGLVTSFGPLLAAGLVFLVLTGLSFLLVPAFAIMRSLASDQE